MEEKESKANYLVYALALVILLIVAAFVVTFAYYKVNTTSSNTLVDVSASLDCIDLKLSNSGSNINLSYNYPITDELASKSGSITPVTVSVTNNCSDTKKYTLALSTLSLTNSPSTYIDDNKIRIKIVKNDNVYFKGPKYLSSLSQVSTTNQLYKDLIGTNGELANKYPDYTLKKIYAIEDVQTIEPNNTNNYFIYLWVDYYEGDKAMYMSNNAIHDETYDGTTAGKKFAAAISLSLNTGGEGTSSNIITEYLINNVPDDELWNSTLENDGYRYVGTNPDNYICFGTSDMSTCTSDTDKYMYRIIGIFDDSDGKKHVKLIKKEALNTLHKWNSNSSADVDWNNSDLYKGLNESYFLTNSNYSYMQDSTWSNKIFTWDYTMTNTRTYDYDASSFLGIRYDSSSAKLIYLHELNRSSKTSSIGEWKNLNTKIGLMYASDYALSLGSTALNLTSNSNSSTLKTSWMYLSNNEWTMSRFGYGGDWFSYIWFVNLDGQIKYDVVTNEFASRPVFYLESNVELADNTGDGSITNPYIIIE